jgi:hypothetical protein
MEGPEPTFELAGEKLFNRGITANWFSSLAHIEAECLGKALVG